MHCLHACELITLLVQGHLAATLAASGTTHGVVYGKARLNGLHLLLFS